MITDKELAPHQRHQDIQRRLAIVVSHPVQYYVPLYQRLALRHDLTARVFYTWFGGGTEVRDSGFDRDYSCPHNLLEGYDFEVVPNTARRPGTDHFWGLQNPELVGRIAAWQPDAIHLSGYAYASHLALLYAMSRRRIPVLFRGDSHLLRARGWKLWLKRAVLPGVFRRPAAFLYVGMRNRDYFRTFGVPARKLFACAHSIDVDRFTRSGEQAEQEAIEWRRSLGIAKDQLVLLFAGKFQEKKQPVELMKAVCELPAGKVTLVMVGDGPLGEQVRQLASQHSDRFRVLPFQSQSKMPIVYRLGDVLVLPSSHSETWGLAVNEAFACGRPALVSDQVGCAPDLIVPGQTGEIFAWNDWGDFRRKLLALGENRQQLGRMAAAAARMAWTFSIEKTEAQLMVTLESILGTGAVGSYRTVATRG